MEISINIKQRNQPTFFANKPSIGMKNLGKISSE